MKLSLTSTTSAKLASLPVVNGQLIYLTDTPETYYDINGARRQISSVKIESMLPQTGRTGTLYAIPTALGSTQSNAYVWDATNNQFVMVSSPVSIATTSKAGIVKPDGSTITVTADGTITAIGTTYAPATTSVDGLMSSTDKIKLNGVESGAQINQNAFSNVLVGDVTVAAENATDSLTLEAGPNITLTPDASTDKVTISAKDTTYAPATTSADGLMSSSDKTKLDGIASGAEVNQHAFSNFAVGDVTIAADNKTDTLTLVAGNGITLTPDASNDQLTITALGTTYAPATTTTDGLMSAADKIKVDALGTASTMGATTVVESGSNDLVTSGAVFTAIDNLPEPMVFKGSLGEGGTISDLPAASSQNEGFTYKVITAGTYASQAAQVGDLFISNGSAWVWIPSGDEPSGTVTSVATGVGLTGGPITSSGTIKANLKSETALTNDSAPGAEVAGKVYPVAQDASGYLAVAVPWENTEYESIPAASGSTEVSLVTAGEKYTWNNKSDLTIGPSSTQAAAGDHTHSIGMSTSSGTAEITLQADTKYQLTAGGSSYILQTPADTWRGIQNSLASTSTVDSLSAAQGKVLNDRLSFLEAFGTIFRGTKDAWDAMSSAEQNQYNIVCLTDC